MRDNKMNHLKAKEILAEPQKLAGYIDHTLLKPEASTSDIEKICAEAKQYSFKAVCVNPDRVQLARTLLMDTSILIASVVGFPLGAHLSEVKARETELALLAGATEIDMVLNIAALKEKNFDLVANDIRAVVLAANPYKVKVIFETGLLTVDEIRTACKISESSGAQFVKTSTGFLGRGASVDDIKIMFESVSDRVEIKASGGIRDLKSACEMIAAGATRIGTSSGVQLVQALPATSSY